MNDPIANIYADARAPLPMVVISFDAGPNCIVTQAITAEAARRVAITLFRKAKESRLKHKQLCLPETKPPRSEIQTIGLVRKEARREARK